jgi:hypothetical protein
MKFVNMLFVLCSFEVLNKLLYLSFAFAQVAHTSCKDEARISNVNTIFLSCSVLYIPEIPQYPFALLTVLVNSFPVFQVIANFMRDISVPEQQNPSTILWSVVAT